MALSGNLVGESAGTISPAAGYSSAIRLTSDAAATTVGRQVPAWTRDVATDVSEDVAPLMAMLQRTRKPRTVFNQQYQHTETDQLPSWIEIDGFGGSDGDGVTIALTSGQGARVRVQDLIWNPESEEVMQVTAISTDTLTVTRGFGSSSASTLSAGDDLEIMSGAFTEASAAPDGLSSEPSIETNYVQNDKVAIEISGRAQAHKVHGKDELARITADALAKLKLRQEKMAFHGARNSSDPTASGGLDYYLSSNVTAVGGALTEATMNTIIKGVMRKNQGKDIVAFTGELGLDAIDGFGRDAIQYRPEDKKGGIALGSYHNSHGKLLIKKHGLLTVNATKAGLMYLVNMAKINLVELRGRGLVRENNVETPGTDARKDYFMTDSGLDVFVEQAHAKATGITG